MALVVADTLENATAAACRSTSTYELLRPASARTRCSPTVPSPTSTTDRSATAATLPITSSSSTEEKLQDRRGEPRTVPGPHRVAAHYTTPHNAHYPIELSATIAAWDGDSADRARQHPLDHRRAHRPGRLSRYPRGPRSAVLSPLVGGAFGSKSFLWMHVVLCAVAAREVGRPVKLVLTRDQMFSSTGHRPRTEQDLVLVADDDGTHPQHRTPHPRPRPRPSRTSANRPVCRPGSSTTHRTSRCRTAPPGSTRPPHVSCAAGGGAGSVRPRGRDRRTRPRRSAVDPLELRLRNHADHDQASGKPWSGKHLLDCYRDGGAALRLGRPARSQPRALRRNGVQVGLGMATATYPGRRMAARAAGW